MLPDLNGAVLLDRNGRHKRLGEGLVIPGLEDVLALRDKERARWPEIKARLNRTAAWTASQDWCEIAKPIPVADETQITGTAEAVIFPSKWTAIGPDILHPNTTIIVIAAGVMTTPASAATTLTVTPRFGTSVSGTALGASAASPTATVSLTNTPWQLFSIFTCRAVGASGTAKVIISGFFTSRAIGAATAPVQPLNFGGVEITSGPDTTASNAILFGFTLGGSASWTAKMTQVACLWQNQ